MRGMNDFDAALQKRLTLLEKLMGPEQFGEALCLFLEDTPVRLDALTRAAAHGDGPTLRAVTHTLRGSSAILGALSVARACTALEGAVRAGHYEAAQSLTRGVQREFERVRRAFARPGRCAA